MIVSSFVRAVALVLAYQIAPATAVAQPSTDPPPDGQPSTDPPADAQPPDMQRPGSVAPTERIEPDAPAPPIQRPRSISNPSTSRASSPPVQPKSPAPARPNTTAPAPPPPNDPFAAEFAIDSAESVDANELDLGDEAHDDFEAEWDAMETLRRRKSKTEYRRRLGLGFSMAGGAMAIGSVLILATPACGTRLDCNDTTHLALGSVAGGLALAFGGTGIYLLLDARKRRLEEEAMRMSFVVTPDGSWAVAIGGRFGG